MKRSYRVYIGCYEVAGYYSNLTRGLKKNDIQCDFITYRAHPFGYGGESPTPLLIRLGRRAYNWRNKSGKSGVISFILALPAAAFFHAWGLFAIFRYDAFIFSYGQTLFFRNLDLILLRLLKKRVIVNLAHGSEARPPYINGVFQSKNGDYPSVKKIHYLARMIKKSVFRNEQWSSVVIGSPLSTSQFCESKFVNCFLLGIPIDITSSQVGLPKSKYPVLTDPPESVRILHAPSNRVAKGTAAITSAIESLRFKGHEIEFVLLEGHPHAEVLEELQRCDFVVDQLYSDTPMAGFVAEAARQGKAAVVGGYGLQNLVNRLPKEMIPPSKICHPENIEQAIEDLVINRHERYILGREAQAFVLEKWNAEVVGRRYIRLLRGDIPNEWLLEPTDICYLYGGCLKSDDAIKNIRNLVSSYGVNALQLTHNPELEKAFLKFANIDK